MAKEFAYTVRGHWPFPLDMLRHDGSRAATDKDQRMIDRLSGEFSPDRAAFEDEEVNLVGPNKPNTARWESFLWAVPHDADYQAMKIWEAKAKAREKSLVSAMSKMSRDELAAIEWAAPNLARRFP